jgi:predicted amidohydrolase YtcJ
MFADCHLHLLAYARSLTELDLGSHDCPTIPDVLARLRQVPVRDGGWVVARGFDDALASPSRLLERAELDVVFPETPVRLRHRTGHASLLNSAALTALPPLPAGASLALDRREQVVLLVGAESWLDSISGRPERAELIHGLRQADVELARVHIARVWDASPRSKAAQANLLELAAEAGFSRQLRLMASPDAAQASTHASAVKVFASHPDDLTMAVSAAHRAGLPVAVHATEPWEIESAVTAIERCATPELTDRVEHATLISRIQAERLAAVGSVVVANPGWIVSRSAKYQAQLRDDQPLRIMPLATLLRTGCGLAFGSDAPVDRPDPGHWVCAAVDRLGPERITTEQALEAAIGAAAWRDTDRKSATG